MYEKRNFDKLFCQKKSKIAYYLRKKFDYNFFSSFWKSLKKNWLVHRKNVRIESFDVQ